MIELRPSIVKSGGTQGKWAPRVTLYVDGRKRGSGDIGFYSYSLSEARQALDRELVKWRTFAAHNQTEISIRSTRI